MKKFLILLFIFISIFIISVSFRKQNNSNKISNLNTSYSNLFKNQLNNYSEILNRTTEKPITKKELHFLRIELKKIDFWLRYFNPIDYKKLNGPLPIEYETEVFEKFEKPYKRIGKGLTLAELALDENQLNVDSLLNESKQSLIKFQSDSIHQLLTTYHHFYFCNRLFLLNLATIYTTGFECPDTLRIIPELKSMLKFTEQIYSAYDESFPEHKLSPKYWNKFNELNQFIKDCSNNYSDFDHFTFIKEYINPLFQINQTAIQINELKSKNLQDYSLNNNANSIFSKNLYEAQSNKGIYHRIKNESLLEEIKQLGELLFYDPILSGNNQRSCASCHEPTTGFTTKQNKPLHFNRTEKLNRNSPSLLNSNFQHLIMLDGKHINLHQQAVDVITNKDEMNGESTQILKKILSCKEYKTRIKKIVQNTPGYSKLTLDHITSAIVYYYTSFSYYDAPFDDMINKKIESNSNIQKGFNLFMSKAQCATCHFLPQFNGVKPPYIGSEFEVLGVTENKVSKIIDPDKGRGVINPVEEMTYAFRTNTIRNSSITAPYMHNGIYNTLEEVIEFYNQGGGNGQGVSIENQTLNNQPLNLSEQEKKYLIEFIKSLDENIPYIQIPEKLPISSKKILKNRKVKGNY